MNSTFQKKFTFRQNASILPTYISHENNISLENYNSRENTYFLRECLITSLQQ